MEETAISRIKEFVERSIRYMSRHHKLLFTVITQNIDMGQVVIYSVFYNDATYKFIVDLQRKNIFVEIFKDTHNDRSVDHDTIISYHGFPLSVSYDYKMGSINNVFRRRDRRSKGVTVVTPSDFHNVST